MSYARGILRAALFMLTLVALAILSAVLTMKLITWGATVPVPDVSGRDLTWAITELKRSGLDIRVERQEHHRSVPAGSIISQLPHPGESVKKGRDVVVVVSLGSEEVAAPNLAGGLLRQSQVTLKQAGLVLGEVARAHSASPRDEVILQEPAAGSVMQKGEAVNLLVSEGPQADKFVAPELAGMTPSDAAEALKPFGVKARLAGKGDEVTAQAPMPGYPMEAGGEVVVTLGTKPPKPPEKKPEKKIEEKKPPEKKQIEKKPAEKKAAQPANIMGPPSPPAKQDKEKTKNG